MHGKGLPPRGGDWNFNQTESYPNPYFHKITDSPIYQKHKKYQNFMDILGDILSLSEHEWQPQIKFKQIVNNFKNKPTLLQQQNREINKYCSENSKAVCWLSELLKSFGNKCVENSLHQYSYFEGGSQNLKQIKWKEG